MTKTTAENSFLQRRRCWPVHQPSPVRRPTPPQRTETAKGSGDWKVVNKPEQWEPKKTVVIICDMWNQHSKGATERVAEMAPRMNDVVKAARQRRLSSIAPAAC